MKTIVIGAGGHCRAVLDILFSNPELDIVGIVDEDVRLHNANIEGVKILGDFSHVEKRAKAKELDAVCIAIGDNTAREMYFNKAHNLGLHIIGAIHPRAIISRHAKPLGKGVHIGANTIIGPNVTIGDNVLINANVVIPHNNIIQDHVNISPGVNMGGGTIIEKNTFIGVGASIVQYIKIGANTLIGAGAAVTEDIPANVVAVGIPAKVTRELKEGLSKALYVDRFRLPEHKESYKVKENNYKR